MKSLLLVVAALFSMNASAGFEVVRQMEVPEVAPEVVQYEALKEEMQEEVESEPMPGSGLSWDGSLILKQSPKSAKPENGNDHCNMHPGQGLVLNGKVMLHMVPEASVYSLHQQILMYAAR